MRYTIRHHHPLIHAPRLPEEVDHLGHVAYHPVSCPLPIVGATCPVCPHLLAPALLLSVQIAVSGHAVLAHIVVIWLEADPLKEVVLPGPLVVMSIDREVGRC